MHNILITGGAGFIGINLAQNLLSTTDAKITILDNFLTSNPSNLNSLIQKHSTRTSFIEHDISNPLPKSLFQQNFTQIYHFASPASPKDYLEIPLQTSWSISAGTKNILDFAAKTNTKLFLASSSEIYFDETNSHYHESNIGKINPFGQRSSYRAAKHYAESLAFHYFEHFQFPLIIGRIFNAYGPNQRLNDGRVIPSFIKSALSNEPLEIYGNGEQTRTFIYIDDLIHQILAATSNSENFTVLNLGSPHSISINQLAKQILELTNSNSPIINLPNPKDEAKSRSPDLSGISKLIQNVAPTTIQKGLKQTIIHYQQ